MARKKPKISKDAAVNEAMVLLEPLLKDPNPSFDHLKESPIVWELLPFKSSPELHIGIKKPINIYSLEIDKKKFSSKAFEKYVLMAEQQKYVFDALVKVSARWLQEKDIPIEVRLWIADVLTGKRKKPSKSGRKSTRGRDFYLALATYRIVKAGFQLGKDISFDKKNPNAFDIVAEAANNIGLKKIGFFDVKNSWYTTFGHLAKSV